MTGWGVRVYDGCILSEWMVCYTNYMSIVNREIRIPPQAVPRSIPGEQVDEWLGHELTKGHDITTEEIHHVTSTNLAPDTTYANYRLPHLAGITVASIPSKRVTPMKGWSRVLTAIPGSPRPQVEIGLPPGQETLRRREALEAEAAELREHITESNRGLLRPLEAYPNYTQTVELPGEPGQSAEDLRQVAQEFTGNGFFETIIYNTSNGNPVARATVIGPDSGTLIEPILNVVERNPGMNPRIHPPIRLVGVFEAHEPTDNGPEYSRASFDEMLERVDFKGHENPYVGKRTRGSRSHDTYRRR
jgi:hypothetical protein